MYMLIRKKEKGKKKEKKKKIDVLYIAKEDRGSTASNIEFKRKNR